MNDRNNGNGDQPPQSPQPAGPLPIVEVIIHFDPNPGGRTGVQSNAPDLGTQLAALGMGHLALVQKHITGIMQQAAQGPRIVPPGGINPDSLRSPGQ